MKVVAVRGTIFVALIVVGSSSPHLIQPKGHDDFDDQKSHQPTHAPQYYQVHQPIILQPIPYSGLYGGGIQGSYGVGYVSGFHGSGFGGGLHGGSGYSQKGGIHGGSGLGLKGLSHKGGSPWEAWFKGQR
ncbi:uncharacterized protein LOC135199935 [Macrobrachium nipponense]|uniref:uncharacterized protein LOC135199935 n=1 Tax=Macrobrachium nipponense TaxID=159736 RepID=UPI0030C844C1